MAQRTISGVLDAQPAREREEDRPARAQQSERAGVSTQDRDGSNFERPSTNLDRRSVNLERKSGNEAQKAAARRKPRQELHTGGAAYADAPRGQGHEPVITEFRDFLQRDAEGAVAVAAINALVQVVQRSEATTMMGLQKELNDAAAILRRSNETAISLKAGCELFLRYATRVSALEMEDFAAAKARMIQRGRSFAETSNRARHAIAEQGARFIRGGHTVLVHGHSRVVLTLLRKAASLGITFSVVLTEGRPDETGRSMANALDKLKIPTVVILDCAAAWAIEALKVNMVLVGAEGVVENGGVINKLGTCTLAITAHALGCPFYVAAESYKFARLYPLSQSDLPAERKQVDFGPLMPASVRIDNPSRDYTPPKYVSLLFTDLGILTPAAVSDELIQLYG